MAISCTKEAFLRALRSPALVSHVILEFCCFIFGTYLVHPLGALLVFKLPFQNLPNYNLVIVWGISALGTVLLALATSGVLCRYIPVTRVLTLSFILGFAGAICFASISDSLVGFWVATCLYFPAFSASIPALVTIQARQVPILNRTGSYMLSGFLFLIGPGLVMALVQYIFPSPGASIFVALMSCFGVASVLFVHEQPSHLIFEDILPSDLTESNTIATTSTSFLPTTAPGSPHNPSSSTTAVGQLAARGVAFFSLRLRTYLPVTACSALSATATFTLVSFAIWASTTPAPVGYTQIYVVAIVLLFQLCLGALFGAVFIFTKFLSDRVLIAGLSVLCLVGGAVQWIENDGPSAVYQYGVAAGLICASAVYLISVSLALLSKLLDHRWLSLKFAGLLLLLAASVAAGLAYGFYIMVPNARPSPLLHLVPLFPLLACVLVIVPLWRRLIPQFVLPWTQHVEEVPFHERLWRIAAVWDKRTHIHDEVITAEHYNYGITGEEGTASASETTSLFVSPAVTPSPSRSQQQQQRIKQQQSASAEKKKVRSSQAVVERGSGEDFFIRRPYSEERYYQPADGVAEPQSARRHVQGGDAVPVRVQSSAVRPQQQHRAVAGRDGKRESDNRLGASSAAAAVGPASSVDSAEDGSATADTPAGSVADDGICMNSFGQEASSLAQTSSDSVSEVSRLVGRSGEGSVGGSPSRLSVKEYHSLD